MLKKITTHLKHYLPLVGIFVAAALGYYLFSYDKAFQIMIIMASGASYVAWGVIHHYIHNDLDLEIVLEYVVIALLGIVVVYSLVVRG